MKTLIIYAHPETPGFCPEILNQVEKKLKKDKQGYEVLDLYKMKFNPVLMSNEHYTSGNKEITQETKEIQKKITDSKRLIFIFPLWWYSCPAILKGFFDRVLTPHFAYKYEGPIPKKLLKGKEAILFYTSGGPKIYYGLMSFKHLHCIKDTLKFVGISYKIYQFASARNLDNKRKKEIKNVVSKALGG